MFLSDKATVCIIMGAGNDEYGVLDSDAIDRCEMLLEVYKYNPEIKYILCGGNGDHFNTTENKHYRYLQDYLKSKYKNINRNCIGYIDSYNTIDDVKGSLSIVESNYKNVTILALTNDYHVARTSYLLNKYIKSENSFKVLSKPSAHPKEWLKYRYEHEYNRIRQYISNAKISSQKFL